MRCAKKMHRNELIPKSAAIAHDNERINRIYEHPFQSCNFISCNWIGCLCMCFILSTCPMHWKTEWSRLRIDMQIENQIHHCVFLWWRFMAFNLNGIYLAFAAAYMYVYYVCTLITAASAYGFCFDHDRYFEKILGLFNSTIFFWIFCTLQINFWKCLFCIVKWAGKLKWQK